MMFDCEMSDCGATETVATLKQAWTGEPFEFQAAGADPPDAGAARRPPVILGGTGEGSPPGRRIADGFMPSDGSIWDGTGRRCWRSGSPIPARTSAATPAPSTSRTTSSRAEAVRAKLYG
jgi:alkanesulfonate monooxygenase SsuD/methylene tetrahydromethanopterin reductase-like flavin-dependent oxidoreductase (luciferase family)